ncbi:MAG: hypothetical protein UR27_C0011G0033 [Candidatus Peregrinibacteria bacterium GW2011_GWA2_33_10]|nr:MAG: hypothetical protein UR27_C0011G0033 [Candidatus Peregrinibacteria bacterium GW2011_GWA2_33_10]KKP38894.1 MAG: hypothetical protein UR30_C0014G0032 [Candidatus Peregrinibacteria bacterium GW2011_GWC2_33_13]
MTIKSLNLENPESVQKVADMAFLSKKLTGAPFAG